MGKKKEELKNIESDKLMDELEIRRTNYRNTLESLRAKIIGAKVVSITQMSDETAEAMYGEWGGHKTPVLITLDSGVEINAQSDEENNEPGTFAFFDPKTGAEAYDWDFTRNK